MVGKIKYIYLFGIISKTKWIINCSHVCVNCSFVYYCYSVYDVKADLKLQGGSGGAMVLGKLPLPGRPTTWMIVRLGPIAHAVSAGGGCLDIFTLLYLFSPFSLSLGDGRK